MGQRWAKNCLHCQENRQRKDDSKTERDCTVVSCWKSLDILLHSCCHPFSTTLLSNEPFAHCTDRLLRLHAHPSELVLTLVDTDMYVMALPSVYVWLCRLQKQGIRILVERPVHRTEFPEFDAFDAENDGMFA